MRRIQNILSPLLITAIGLIVYHPHSIEVAWLKQEGVKQKQIHQLSHCNLCENLLDNPLILQGSTNTLLRSIWFGREMEFVRRVPVHSFYIENMRGRAPPCLLYF